MRIGGLLKHSLIDFPGTPCCVVFTSGCNFICPYCHNPELADPSRFLRKEENGKIWTQDQVLAFLDKRKNLLQGVAITGGEPTLQPDLVDFIKMVRQKGFSVKLDTNGTRPKVLETLLEEGLVDYVAMDIKTSMAEYPAFFAKNINTDKTLEGISRSIQLIMEKAPAYEFRTTCVRPFMSESAIKDISKTIQGASSYFLQQCSSASSGLDPAFMSESQHFFSSQDLVHFKEIAQERGLQVRLR